MNFPIIMHINYCEQGQSLSEICQKAVDWGFDGVEFRRKRHGVEEGVEEYLDTLADSVEKSGLRHVLFGGPGPDLMQPDAEKRRKEVETIRDFFRLAAERFRLTVCNTMTGPLHNPDPQVSYSDYDKNGSAVATDDHRQWAAEGFRELGAMAEKMGFRFAFEVHMCYLHDLPESTRKLVDEIGSPAVGANLDYGNVVYFEEPPALAEAIGILGDKLYYVHLKNSTATKAGDRIPTALADGQINHREYISLLIRHGYEGPICVEAPRPGDREWFARQDLAYIQSVLTDCTGE